MMNTALLISGLFLLILSIPFYMGKFTGLIAGYNTMSQEEKDKYDQKKLCRILAMTLDVEGILLLLGATHILDFNSMFVLCIVISPICITLANTIAKK